MATPSSSLFSPALLRPALVDALRKLDPRSQAKNPVMFVTWVGAALCTLLCGRSALMGGEFTFAATLSLWLWSTVLFANLAEAVAEGRGKAQAASLRKLRTEVVARRLVSPTYRQEERVPAATLRKNDRVLCEPG
ncbi:MAG TPA: potassium-transporting ATPase subunit B, partial [Myxococcota bacterium]|nr:potassium-transporting ATPase subunit B [Myxococcota bacterium]